MIEKYKYGQNIKKMTGDLYIAISIKDQLMLLLGLRGNVANGPYEGVGRSAKDSESKSIRLSTDCHLNRLLVREREHAQFEKVKRAMAFREKR